MNSIIIGFSGKIGSGKTTLSAAVAEALNWPCVSFGDYVREVARRKGVESSRKMLQEIGALLVENPDEFCLSLLKQYGWKPGQHLIVDGIRHVKIIYSLRKVTEPSRVFLIFVEVDEKVRKKRLLNYKDIAEQEDQELESHVTEAEVKTILPAMADLLVDGTRPVPDILNQILGWINGIEGC
ncbi:MAG: AAA family ATPase [Candidatus Hodarchaeota archaeon]